MNSNDHVIRGVVKEFMPIIKTREGYLFSYDGINVADLPVPYDEIINCDEKFVITEDLLIDVLARKSVKIGGGAKLSSSRKIVAVLDFGGLKIFDYDDIERDPIEYDDVDIDCSICVYEDEVIVKKDDGFYRYNKEQAVKENRWACEYVSVCDGYLLCNGQECTYGSNDDINFMVVYGGSVEESPWMSRFEFPSHYDDFRFQSDDVIYFLDNKTLLFCRAGYTLEQLNFSDAIFADI